MTSYDTFDAYTSPKSLSEKISKSDQKLNESSNKVADENKTTSIQTFILLLKGYVGPGCLSLPWAVSQLGIIPGSIAIFVMAYWTSYNCWSVVKLKRMVASENATFSDVSQILCGSKMKFLTTLCICVQQLAICTVFLSFVGENVQAVIQSVYEVPISHLTVITFVLPAAIGLSFLPNMKALATCAALATALLLIGFSLLAVIVFLEWPHRPHEPLQSEWKTVPLALCAILYSYEGICLILPIEAAMKEQKRFLGVFVSAMGSVASILTIVASFSILAFGNVTNGSITAFLLEHYKDHGHIRNWIFASNAFVSLSVLVTYPLQLFPALELLGPILAGNGNKVTDENTVCSPWTRVNLVILTYLVAVFIPNVQLLISLAGALAGSSIALLIPPILTLAHQRQHSEASHENNFQSMYCFFDKLRSCFLFLLGVVFLCIGTSAAILDIIRVKEGKE